jgi:hypothetical protein
MHKAELLEILISRMMTKFLKCFTLTLLGMTMLFQTNLAQKEPVHESIVHKTIPVISGLHTLSIHVRDTITHDSVFHFLVDKLKLPVYYYPVTSGQRKYAGVYAGNLVLEPCGPYSNFPYGPDDFRAIFFGLTFEPYESISLSARGLNERKINHQTGDTYIYLQKDSTLCGDKITVSFIAKDDRIGYRRKIDSLQFTMAANNENGLGIEYVKEIFIGYKDDSNLKKWKELISPSELINNLIWQGSNILEFHFIKSNIKEVQSITFKVKSLEKAKLYLFNNKLIGSFIDNKIELDKAQTFGLSMYITEDE